MLHEQIASITSKEDLARFVGALRRDLKEHADEWENPTLETFLEAMESWIESTDGFYRNKGQEAPPIPNWKTFADILYAARIYE